MRQPDPGSLQCGLHVSRVLRYLNWLIAIVLLAAISVGYWFGYRPLPTTSGSIKAAISGPATITRDDLGVPHIKAATIEDAVLLQGFVTAQDRMWQMDVLRRHASGTLAEVAGPAAVEEDTMARRLRIRRIAEGVAGRISGEDARWLAAFARGVNYYIETNRGRLPIEFTLMGYDPHPWTIADSLSIAIDMHRDLTSSWRQDVGRAAMYTRGNAALLQQLFLPRTGLEIQPGSNAWVLSGNHTATGKPLLANDPHLRFSVPSLWYTSHLQAPGLNVAGVSLPGIPGIIIGHNERIAWGVTNLEFDVQDLYMERLDPRTGQYVHAGQVRQAARERDLIAVKGGSPVELTNWVTLHGPVWTTTGNQALTLRWSAADVGSFQFPILELDRATDWASFRKALARYPGPAQNFVYADVDGNIGYQVAGVLPVRNGFRGELPVDGISGRFEWAGTIPFDDLPSTYNPPSGVIITANQNPFPPDWKYAVNGEFDSGYRARQIRALLSARGGWKPEGMLTVQKDVYSPYHHFLAGQIVAAPGADASVVSILRNWNGQMEKDLAAPLIVSLFSEQLRLEIGKRAAGQTVPSDSPFNAASVERLLRSRPKEWFQNWDSVITGALNNALDEGRRLQGRDINSWKYGRSIALNLRHPVLSQIRWLGPYVGAGEALMSGSTTTIKQTTTRLGPSMRFVADLGNWEHSLLNLTLGQSGHVLSGHFKDQWNAYWTGKSYPMHWKVSGGDLLEVRPVSSVRE